MVELLFAAACRKSVFIRNVKNQLSGEYLPENIPLLSKELLIPENMPSCLCLMAQYHCASIARVIPDIKKTQQFNLILKWSPTKVVVGLPSFTEGEKEETDVSREVVWISWGIPMFCCQD